MPHRIQICPWCSTTVENHECTNSFALFAARAENHKKHIILKKSRFDTTNAASGSVFLLSRGGLRADVYYKKGAFSDVFYSGAVFCLNSISEKCERADFFSIADSLILEVGAATIRDYLSQGAENFSSLLYYVQMSSRRLCHRLYQVSSISLRDRLQNALYYDFFYRGQINDGNAVVTKALKHNDWANITGARRESVSRLMKDFEAEGLIHIDDSSVMTKDMSALFHF